MPVLDHVVSHLVVLIVLRGWCIRDGCCSSISTGDSLGRFAAMRQRETDPMAPIDFATDRPGSSCTG